MKAICVSILVILTACQRDNNAKIEYYENGIVKRQYSLNSDENFDGLATTYYESGEVKYVGNYNDGLRIGEHIENYRNGKIKKYFRYEIVGGEEKWIEKKSYDESDLILFDIKHVSKKFEYKILNNMPISSGDTVSISIALVNPTYTNSIVFLGNYDANLNVIIDDASSQRFEGSGSKVVVSYPAKEGDNKISGMFRDFTMDLIPGNDTLGYTIAEESYFEYHFNINEGRSI